MGTSLEFLGIARKAGFLEIGEESCAVAVSAKKARLLITACDASDNAKRNAARQAAMIGVPHVTVGYNKEELGCMVGRGYPGQLALTDAGMAAGFMERLEAEEPGAHTEALALLQKRAARAAERRKEARAHARNVRTGKSRRRKE